MSGPLPAIWNTPKLQIFRAEDNRISGALPEQLLRLRYAHRAARGALTVRQIEKLAARRAQGKQLQPPSPPQLDPNMRSALEELQRHLGTRIILRLKTKVRPGQLVLEFYDDAQLMGLYDRLMK